MEKKLRSTSVIPPPEKHLKPLSVYSRMVTCNQKDSPLPPRPGKLSSFQTKVQVDKNLGKKRKLEDADYQSPKIKPISPHAFSPDLGCFMDYSSPAGRDSLSPFTPSPQEPNEKIQDPARDLCEVLGSPSMKHVDLRCKLDTKRQRISSDFDNDVDDIFCLNPLRQEEQQKLHPVSSVTNNVTDDDEGCPAETTLKQKLPQEVLLCSQRLSFLEDDLNDSVTRPLSGPVPSTGSCLEGVVKEGWNIGAPKFESSVCEGSPAAERTNQVSQVQDDSVLSEELGTTGDSLWETTLPLQVQVQSKVVVPSKISLQPISTKDNGGRRNRPTVYSRKSEWEHQSRQYVNDVVSHMREDQGCPRAVMTELLDLMSSVSGQSRSHGARWQHPSDLTRRNYQQRFNKETALMSLSEWQRKNNLTYKRFAKIPKIFQRSSAKH